MSGESQTAEIVMIPQDITVPYVYSMGAIGSRFFVELRDNKKIMAIKCPQCNRVYVPPRLTCARCFVNMEEWVELDGKGALLTYTMVNYPLPIHPVEAPFAYGVIKLDGADTGLTHMLGEVDFADIKIGMRLEPVFKENREGDILDIKYFRPVK